MGLLAHQEKITQAIMGHSVTSIAAPRCNGKTYAALWAAVTQGGTSLYVASGFAAARVAFDTTKVILDKLGHDPSRIVARNGALSIEFAASNISPSGRLRFLSYNRNGSRGCTADTAIFDDAEMADPGLLAVVYPSLLQSQNPRIVAISVAPDAGLAEHLWSRSDATLRWGGDSTLTVAEANPGMGQLIPARSIESAAAVLPAAVYAREHLGITA